MKRGIVICALLIVSLSSRTLFAKPAPVGIGPEISYSPPHAVGLSVTFNVTRISTLFSITTVLDSAYYMLGGTADYLFWQKKVHTFNTGETVELYLGAGGEAFFTITRSGTQHYLGSAILARMPFGVSFFVKKRTIEPYIQVALALGLSIGQQARSAQGNLVPYFAWRVPLSFGCRFWI